MTRPMIRIHNLETDIIEDREMNEEEYNRHLAFIETEKQAKAELEAKEQARHSAINKLIDLGLTEEEAKAFLG